ncbi:hypothetical protein Salat_2086700 [Sesamum alatum]|uniref:Uncharacterized protein n=1 Tax=Sesamum alatum TaxID=300844 RepID=A0AAE1Y164_9LAMI|nr:hypothetical protein Salat_2086700 [Sesamum alatum]
MDHDLNNLGKALSLSEEAKSDVVVPMGLWHRDTEIEAKVDSGDNPKDIDRNLCEFHVLIHNLPLGKMTRDIKEFIGNQLGKFVDVDMDDKAVFWGSFLRIRVALDVNKPLRRAPSQSINRSRSNSSQPQPHTTPAPPSSSVFQCKGPDIFSPQASNLNLPHTSTQQMALHTSHTPTSHVTTKTPTMINHNPAPRTPFNPTPYTFLPSHTLFHISNTLPTTKFFPYATDRLSAFTPPIAFSSESTTSHTTSSLLSKSKSGRRIVQVRKVTPLQKQKQPDPNTSSSSNLNPSPLKHQSNNTPLPFNILGGLKPIGSNRIPANRL